MTLPDAGLAHGAGAVLTNWKKADDMKILEKAGSNNLRGHLLLVLMPVYPPCDCSQIAVFLLSSNLMKRQQIVSRISLCRRLRYSRI